MKKLLVSLFLIAALSVAAFADCEPIPGQIGTSPCSGSAAAPAPPSTAAVIINAVVTVILK